MTRRRALARMCAAAVLAAASAGCGRSEAQTLILTGSSTVAPLLAEIGRRFEEEHPGTRVDVQTGGSSRGVADARAGLADIGMVSRAANDDESDLRWFPVARDGIAIIVHASNPVSGLSSDQVRAIYRRQITSWSEVGGPDLAITLVHKAEGRSTLELFLKFFGLESAEVRPDVVVGDNQQGIKTVATDPSAIGYVSIGTAEYSAGSGVEIRLLNLDGAAASVEAVAREQFLLSRTLHLVTRSEPEGLTREFLDYARSAAVHDLVEAQFFVPLES